MTTRIELGGGEWLEINKRLEDSVVREAMESNEPFGDALSDYLSDSLGEGGDATVSENSNSDDDEGDDE